MKNLNSAAQIATAAQFGSEPINIVGVFWDGATEIKYSDRDLTGIRGSIINLGSLDDIVKLSGGSTSSVTITLSDHEGDLKSIFDRFDLHKKKVKVYQYFDGLSLSDAFVIFTGEINSPITWSEGQRTLTFTVVTKIEYGEVGFAPEEGQFSNVSLDLIGRVWPLCFGDVVHVPATKVVEKVVGTTYSGIGVPDYTLPYKYWHLVERLAILKNGFDYYWTAIEYLNSIGTEAEPLDFNYVELMLNESDYGELVAKEIITTDISYYVDGLDRLLNISDGQSIESSIRNDYIQYIFRQDILKQIHEEVNTYVSSMDKKLEKISELLKSSYDIDLSETTVTEALNAVNSDDSLPSKQQIIDTIGYYNTIAPTLTIAKRVLKDLSSRLEQIKQHKEALEIDIDNQEYVYKNTNSILKKINQLCINYNRTVREIEKIKIIAREQSLMPTKSVAVVGAEKFPQNTVVTVLIKGLAFQGVFSNGVFNAATMVPKYSNVLVGARQTNELDAFWVADASVNLKGCYCLKSFIITPNSPDYDPFRPFDLVRYRVFKVREQIGQKCLIDLIELKDTRTIKNPRTVAPVMDDLPQELNEITRLTSEHTEKERERILEQSLEDYERDELTAIKTKLTRLKELIGQANYDHEIDAINSTIFKNIESYNDKLANLKFKRSAVERADQAISDHEFKELLRLENLRLRLLDQETENITIPNGTQLYYLTGFDITGTIQSVSEVLPPEWFRYTLDNQELVTNNSFIQLPDGREIRVNLLPDSTFWFAEAGSPVELFNTIEEKYVANILPSTVKTVYAYKSISGLKQLVPVPSSYYTINQSDSSYPPLVCTTISLKQRLTQFGENWEDQPYVPLSSSVGPNTVNILEWIIANSTNLSTDSTSFNTVRSQLTKFPSSFALLQKYDALRLLEDIARQARCAIWEKNGVVYLKYLSLEEDSVATIGIDDILEQTLEVSLSQTEDITTKYVATWRPNYAQSKDSELIFRFNVPKYGTSESRENYFIFNIQSLVEKSATFWLIRKSNSWKRVTFKTPLNKLHLETYDTITLDLPDNLIASGPTKAIIERCDYDSSDNSIIFECWTPIRAGQLIPYDLAWPGSVSVGTMYPPFIEINSGYAGSAYGRIPKNIAYKIDPNINLVDQLELRPKDYGEIFPSDEEFAEPNSPLTPLSAQDYVRVKPDAYVLPPFPFDDDGNIKPEYQNISPPAQNNQQVSQTFIGTITEITEGEQDPEIPITGLELTYKVRAPNGVEVDVVQRSSVDRSLSIGASVSVIKNPVSNQYETVDKPNFGTEIKDVLLKEIFDDYLRCEDRGGNEIWVAKAFSLQRTPWDGETVSLDGISVTFDYSSSTSRTATASGEDPEDQVIVPAFVENKDRIVIFRTTTGYSNPIGEAIEWQDINSAARAWAQEIN